MTDSANATDESANPEGSAWHRWDPHIHMPGTLKEDRFVGDDPMDEYVKRLNTAYPPIRALGITDYYVLDSYEKLLAIKEEGKLPHVKLLFPNIELRFAINAGKGSPINVHLLVCPDDKDHVDKTRRFLGDLRFEYNGEYYGCTNDELIRLGYAFRPNAENATHALRLGVEQSKITAQNLSDALKRSKWARQNIMIAVAAGQNDGTGQLKDDGLKALREELQRLSHFIFSGRPGERNYWCGKGADSREYLIERYGGPKPCLHGCDAHEHEKVGNPDQDRYCWIHGDLTFETLKQICFESERRVFIGKEPPVAGRPSDTIKIIKVNNASWLKTPDIPINPGLVAIIGARGSGKTALVEMIAAGAHSVDYTHTNRSFLERAKDYLYNTRSVLAWGDGEPTESSLHIDDLRSQRDDPRVRYLSQQFVDQLCSSDGLADELLSEIERVIFDAHAPDARLGSRNFGELRELRTESIRRRMEKYQELLSDLGDELSIQDDLKRSLEELVRRRKSESADLERMKNDRSKITPADNKPLLERLEMIRTAAEQKSHAIARLERRELKLSSLKEEIKQFKDSESILHLSQLKERYSEAELTEGQWKKFHLSYDGEVNILLDTELASVRRTIIEQKGPADGESLESPERTNAPAYFSDELELSSLTHTLLIKEQRRLEALIGVDENRRKRYIELSSKIVRAEAALEQRDEEIKKAQEATGKIEGLRRQREDAYCNLIGQIDIESATLETLYQPLKDRLNKQSGTLGKLNLSVRREVDMEAWADAGERLIDRSKAGRFRGVGALKHIIKNELQAIWQSGTASEIASAMSTFRKNYSADFWNHAFEDAKRTRDTRKQWYDKIATWLYSTDHVQVKYGLEYESVDIQQLSPGTRGIVLLMLYLSIDKDDERPLIIDQPEENLDPESVYRELVECFKEAKTRRQIIIVTHNANLVVNTDADQVIVASRGQHQPKALPYISYISGSLENPRIRRAVCDILEGGKEAFIERARRLRLLAAQ